MPPEPIQPRHPNIPGEDLPPEACPLSPEDDPTELILPSTPRRELLVAALLLIAGACGAAFIVAYILTSSNEILGLLLAAAFLVLGAALIVVGRVIVPQETVIEARARTRDPEEEQAVAQLVRSAGAGVTRRRLLVTASAAAGAGIVGSAVVGAASLGPWIGDVAVTSPFRAGTKLVDERGRPVMAADLEVGSFLTAFAQGASLEALGSSVILVRLAQRQLQLPPGRRTWAPQGIVAYSKICTHAGCAVAMARFPLYAADAPGPALVCPCHYSTFDVADGGTVLFGPAGRPLPQLPLSLAADGSLQAAGPLSGDIGPAWFGTDRG
jgi:ubiquinol-cytochrome c reductase iron-sulfur subunit